VAAPGSDRAGGPVWIVDVSRDTVFGQRQVPPFRRLNGSDQGYRVSVGGVRCISLTSPDTLETLVCQRVGRQLSASLAALSERLAPIITTVVDLGTGAVDPQLLRSSADRSEILRLSNQSPSSPPNALAYNLRKPIADTTLPPSMPRFGPTRGLSDAGIRLLPRLPTGARTHWPHLLGAHQPPSTHDQVSECEACADQTDASRSGWMNFDRADHVVSASGS
jgi:hypothetical protein